MTPANDANAMSVRAEGERPAVLLVPDHSLYLCSRLPQLLHDAGMAVDIVCSGNNPLARSRYARHVHREADMQAVTQCVARLFNRNQRRWRAVIVVVEDMVQRLAERLDSPALAAWQPGAQDPLAREFLSGKFGLEAVRKAWDLPIPSGRLCHSGDEVSQFGGETGWPIIVKPPHLNGGRGVFQLNDERAARALAAKFRFPCLAQKFIIGRMGVADLLCSRGRPLAWLAAHALKHTRREFGPSTAKLFTAMPALAPLVAQVAARTRFEGFCGFDWIEEAGTGRHYLIEFHPRPTSGVRFGRDCGVDFSAAARAWLAGTSETFATLTQPIGPVVTAHIFPYDLTRCVRERDWAGLRAWLPGAGVVRDIPWDDPVPLLALLGSSLKNRFRASLQPFGKLAAPAGESVP